MISLAANLAPLIKRIPLPLSGIVVIDETYIKIKGNWHYMFTACDGLKGFIISQHISPHRDVRAAAFNNKPPIPLKNHLNKPVDDWAKLLRWITDNVG